MLKLSWFSFPLGAPSQAELMAGMEEAAEMVGMNLLPPAPVSSVTDSP